MLHIFTAVTFIMNTAKGKDRTKETPGHLAAEERRSRENGAALLASLLPLQLAIRPTVHPRANP